MQEPVSPIQITLPVRQLVEFLRRAGSIDNRFTGFDRANEGARIHRKLQRAAVKEHADYAAEVFLRGIFAYEEIEFTLEGRADGIFTAADGVTVVDEIKTTACPAADITPDFAPEHWAQAIVYAAIYAAQHELEEMRVQLTYFQVDEELILRFERHYTAQQLQEEVEALLAEYAPWARRAVEWKKARNSDLQAMQFPFPAYRPGQRAMAGEVYKVCRDGGRLLCQAPTGIGKSMSVLFPALKSMGNESVGPIFYLTARGTTRTAAENALAILRDTEPELHLRSVTLTAKDKICLCETRECTPEACPYANGYYARIKGALWDVLDVPCLTAETLQEYAERHTVCPFELGLDMSLFSDGILCDYNYVFDPHVYLRRFFGEGAGREQYLFLIDEAHNLLERGREMYSAQLYKEDFLTLKKTVKAFSPRMEKLLDKCNRELLFLKRECGDWCIVEEIDAFVQALLRLSPCMEDYLENHDDSPVRREILDFYFEISHFLQIYELMDQKYVVYTKLDEDGRFLLRLFNVDPSTNLKECLQRSVSSVLFSATLLPIQYYKKLLGGEAEDYEVYAKSVFSPEKKGLFLAEDVTSRYTRRSDREYDKIANYIHQTVSQRHGNYMVFFPSHVFLQQVYERYLRCYAVKDDTECLVQTEHMDEAEREAFLQRFEGNPGMNLSDIIHMEIEVEEESSLVGFCVLGGIFSEGIDLKEDSLIGALIVGTGLPQVCTEREISRG